MLTVPWNSNWETIQQDRPDLFPSGVSWMHIANDPKIIEPFIDAYNERINAIFPTQLQNDFWGDIYTPASINLTTLGYPSSGTYSLSCTFFTAGWGTQFAETDNFFPAPRKQGIPYTKQYPITPNKEPPGLGGFVTGDNATNIGTNEYIAGSGFYNSIDYYKTSYWSSWPQTENLARSHHQNRPHLYGTILSPEYYFKNDLSRLNTYSTTEFPSGLICSCGWGYLQALVVGLSKFFIKNKFENTGDNVLYDQLQLLINKPSGLGLTYPYLSPSLKYHSIDSTHASGMCTYAPNIGYSINIPSLDYHNVRFYSSSLLCPYNTGNYNGSGSYFKFNLNRQDNLTDLPNYSASGSIGKQYISLLIDRFPYPSGFIRKFPREIWSSGNIGVDGQIARMFAVNLNPSGVIPALIPTFASGSTTPIFSPSGTEAAPNWICDPTSFYYMKNVGTPTNERINSGKIFVYSSGLSKWIQHPDQRTTPDIITSYGMVQPGDYFGPWILNGLRDALNQMVWTFGLDNHGGELNFQLSDGINESMATFKLTKYGRDISGNIVNNFATTGYSGIIQLSSTISSGINEGINPQIESSVATNSSFFTSSTRSYCYVKPSGFLPLSSGVSRSIDIYSINNFPNSDPINIYDMNGNPGGTTSYLPMNASGLITYTGSNLLQTLTFSKVGLDGFSGHDIGFLLGDTNITALPNRTVGKTQGYETPCLYAVCRWDVPNGFAFTSGTM